MAVTAGDVPDGPDGGVPGGGERYVSEAGPGARGPVLLGGSPLSSAGYEAVVYRRVPAALAGDARIRAHRRELERQLAAGSVIYAVNTGYGAEANREIPAEALGRLQLNTLRSHAVGVGEPVAAEIVRGMLLLKAQAYAQGLPGVRAELVARILTMLNGGIHPVVRAQGSQSASGDLIPNAHVGLALAGEGLVCLDGRTVPARDVMPGPFDLAPKEGVTLTNDVSFATAIAFDVLRDAERLVERAELVAAMTLQAVRGFPDAYDERLIAARPHPGAIASAGHMRAMLAGSSLVCDPGRRHDPYSLRCLPQVHGAVRAALGYARAAVDVEIRSVGDNPLIFAADGDVVSGGNFHGAPLGLPMDAVGNAIAVLAALSQRRTGHLVDPLPGSRLPAKLARLPDEQLGLLLANTAAASLVSECTVRAAPASVTSIAVDVMEDHVSMAALAAQKAGEAVKTARQVIAIELLCAAQALDYQGAAGASAPVQEMHRAVRERLPFLDEDRPVDVAPLEDLL
jgi:histidine ammonia-lyase